jgi:hypothetical protein
MSSQSGFKRVGFVFIERAWRAELDHLKSIQLGRGGGFIGCIKSQSDFLTQSLYSSFSRSSNILIAPLKSLEEAGLLGKANYEPLRSLVD